MTFGCKDKKKWVCGKDVILLYEKNNCKENIFFRVRDKRCFNLFNINLYNLVFVHG